MAPNRSSSRQLLHTPQIVVLQYCLVVLFADNRGEGGTIALYSLLCRYGEEWFNTGLSAHERDFTVSSREDLERRNKEAKWSKRRTAWFQTFTMGTVIAGVALLLGDGVLTPAISVLSAVEGIAVAAPATKTAIVPITIVILILLFAIQSFGTNRVGAVFSPVVIIWLLVLAGMGIYNISLHGAGIFKALNPQYMFEFFIHLGPLSWRMMGGVMLSITGTEALFADIGHFSRQSIQLATCVFVYPCLMLQYLGQSSVLLENPHHWETSFWSAVPGKIYWFVVILSVLATVIASQALISASFSVVSQAMRLNLFPPVKIIHTSAHHATQIYSPDVNWVLMVVTVVIVAAFQSSEALAGAYGIAVCMDMLLTTCLVATVMRLVWGWNLAIPIVFFLFFGLIDGAFLSSNLLKVPHGGWLPLVMAIIVAAVMGLWRWGKGRTMQQRWRFKKPYNKMFSLLTSDSAISSTGDGSFAVADLEAMPVMPIDEDEKDFDDDDEEDDDDYYGVPLSAVSSREPGVAGSGASMRRRISVFDVGYPALGFARTMTASGSSVNQERGRRMSVASGSTRSRSLSLGAPVSVSAPIIPNSILVTAPTPAASETMIYGDAKPADEGPSLAVKFGQPAAQQRTSSPVLPTTTTEPHSPTRIAPRFELPLAAAVSDSAIPASGEEHAAAGAIAAPQSFSSNLDGQGPINTNSQSYRSILAQPGLQRTITTESRNIKIITAASQRSQSVSDMPIGDLAVSVTPAGLLDATIPLPRFPGLGIFYTEITSGIPGVFAHVVNNLGTIPECVVFATIQYANYPHIEDKDRLFVTKGLLNGFWKAVITLGYMDEIIDR